MIELKQELKLAPHLILTPQLKLILKVYQLSTVELNELIVKEAQSNPFLEIEYKDLPQDISSEKNSQEILDIEEFLSKAYLLREDATYGEEDEFSWEKILRSQETLFDHLIWQIRMKDFSEFERKVAEFIISNLDEKGYLTLTIEEISKEFNISVEKVEKIRRKIMFLDPVGVASRDVKECLCVQLEFMGYPPDSLPYLLIQKHFEELDKGVDYFSQTYGYKKEDLEEAFNIIKRLDPFPARNYFDVSSVYIEPDLLFYKEDSEWKVEVLKDKIIKVRLNPNYERLLNTLKKYKLEKKEKKFLKEKFKDAQLLLKALDSRYTSLYKVGKAILDYQVEFLEKGYKYLKPMTLKIIAETTGLHESTISRIVNSKYVQTPLGLFPLKFFFSTGYKKEGEEVVSAKVVKEYIKELISKEDPKKPLSDSAICKVLKEKYGIDIARRTVAKYREELGIPSSRERKKL